MENSKLYELSSKMMDNLTKDFLWYFDTPEQRFEYTSESIWLINPNTEQWIFELEKSGELWYNHEICLTFKKYFNMERSDFESFIMLWVEDVFKRGASTTTGPAPVSRLMVEDVLKRGVSTTQANVFPIPRGVQDALKRGVSTTLNTSQIKNGFGE